MKIQATYKIIESISPSIRRCIFSLLLFLIGFLAYFSALRGYFLSDDFVHIYYMQKMDESIYLLFKNFWSNWLGIPTTAFYRPLISVTLYIDHIIWGWSPVGYHLTNIIFHSLNGVFIFLLAHRLSCNDTALRQFFLPFVAAMLFLLWPIHPEAVYWIIGRVDVQMTFFYLLSLLIFVSPLNKLRVSVKIFLYILSFVASLASKEPAVTLPVAVTAYVFFYLNKETSLLSRIVFALRSTTFYWLILIAYFVLRWYTFGTFGGGYIGEKTDYLSREYWSRWESLRIIFLPINFYLEPSLSYLQKNIVKILFLVGWCMVIFSFIFKLNMKEKTNMLAFSFIAFVATLLPIASVISANFDLQGSRLFYLPIAIFCILLASILEKIHIERRVWPVLISYSGIGLLLAMFSYQLHSNLQPWITSSLEMRNFSNQFEMIVNERDSNNGSNRTIILTEIPDNIYGAQFFRNGTSGLLTLIGQARGRQVNEVIPVLDLDRSALLSVLAKDMLMSSSQELYGVYRYGIGSGFTEITARIDSTNSKLGNAQCSRGVDVRKVHEFHDLIRDGDGWRIIGTDPWVSYKISNCTNQNVGYFQAVFAFSSSDDGKHDKLQAYWAESSDIFTESNSVSIDGVIKDGLLYDYIIPVTTAKTWNNNQSLGFVRLDFPGVIGERLLLQSLHLGEPANHLGFPKFEGETLSGADVSLFKKTEYDRSLKILKLNTNNNDEFLLMPKTTWNPVQSDYLTLNMRIDAEAKNGSSAKFYWSTLHSPEFSEDKAIQFDVIADGFWHEYIVPIKHITRWWSLGAGTQLRLNPFYGKGEVEIKSIKIGQKLITPQLSFLNLHGDTSSPISQIGRERVFLRASKTRNDTVSIVYDGSLVSSKKIQVEISSTPFLTPNIFSSEMKNLIRIELQKTKGIEQLKIQKLGLGMHYLRISPENGKIGDLTSDAIAILIEE